MLFFKNLQTEQQNKIKELEKEVKRVRAEHSNTIQQLKTKFITEKKSYQLDSDSKIQTLEKAANKVWHWALFSVDSTNSRITECLGFDGKPNGKGNYWRGILN